MTFPKIRLKENCSVLAIFSVMHMVLPGVKCVCRGVDVARCVTWQQQLVGSWRLLLRGQQTDS